MKNLLKFSSLVFILFSLLIGNTSFAEEPVASGVFILATVNIQDASIVSQDNNDFYISFSLTNREGLQTGVKYGVELIKQTDKGQFVVDEKVYDESLTLNPNSVTKKDIKYTAPAHLSGEYSLVITSKNTSGFPFGFIDVGNVTLKATEEGIQILPETCFVQVVGEKDSPKYNLLQGVDIKPEENLLLTCTALNSSKSDVSVKPKFETHYRSSYGEVVDQTKGEIPIISFKTNEEKSFSVILPKATTPQAYNVVMTLNESNPVSVYYILNGISATIQSVSLDKDNYKIGETANVSFFYTASSSDLFEGSRYSSAPDSSLEANVTISNGKDRSCAKEQSQTLSTSLPKVNVPFSITSSCVDPKITITITDENNTILDQKEFNVKTTSEIPTESGSKSNILYFIIVGLILIIIIYIIIKRKKVPSDTIERQSNSIPMGIIFFLALALLGFMPAREARAGSLSFNCDGVTRYFTFNMNKTAYNPGETIAAYTNYSFYNASCNSVPLSSQAYLPSTSSEAIIKNYYPYNETTGYITAPTALGSYSMRFRVLPTYEMGIIEALVPFSVVPLPTVTVYANGNSANQTLSSGSSVSIKWSSQNATTCTCTYTGGGSCGSGVGTMVPTNPTPIVVTSTKTFTVNCTN